MIDASTFAISYNAFWHSAAPMCEHFVRKVNIGGVERFDVPMAPSATAKQRALIAELAFSIFVETAASPRSSNRVEIEKAAWEATERRLKPYVRLGLELSRELNSEARGEVDEILRRLKQFFVLRPGGLMLRPMFSGCGFVDASEGDVIANSYIYEVKTVERPFRGSDVRQAITYAALNYASGQFEVLGVGIVNPRRGQYYEIGLEEVSVEISGRPAEDLLSVVARAISSGEISR